MQVHKVVKRSPVAFALALLAAVAMLFVSEGSYWQAIEPLDDLDQIGAARTNIQRLELGVLDAETNQRGYLLTTRSEYLEPYREALQTIDASMQSLEQHYRDSGAGPPRQLLATLKSLTATRLSIIAETVRLHDGGEQAAAKELVLSGLGKDKMDAIREVSAELLAYESSNVARARDRVYRTLLINRIGVAALSALVLVALTMYLNHGTTLAAHQQELKRLARAEHERLETEVQQRTSELTDLTRHLLTAREDERNRLARNLHDDLGGLLTSAKLDAARIKSRLAGTAPEALERLAHLVLTLDSSIALGRRIIEDLRPSTLANLGLVAALEILAREFGERSGVEVHCTMTPVKLSATAELVVYRLMQEAVTNLSKYAQAGNVWFGLSSHNGRVAASVRDDGVGFDARTPSTSAFGLLGMRYRVEAEHGVLAVVSALGLGTTVSMTMPESS